jgi:hypothetical protein
MHKVSKTGGMQKSSLILRAHARIFLMRAGFIIPEFTSFLILSLLMILTLLGAVLHREINSRIEGQE